MSHTIQTGITFDQMAAKMNGNVHIPTNSYTTDATFESIQSLAQALIDQGASARNLSGGGTVAITNYQNNGADAIAVAQSITELPIDNEVRGTITTTDENGIRFTLEWRAYYREGPAA